LWGGGDHYTKGRYSGYSLVCLDSNVLGMVIEILYKRARGLCSNLVLSCALGHFLDLK